MSAHPVFSQGPEDPASRQEDAELETPAQVEMAARIAGVELRVVGAESCEETGLAARMRKGGRLPPELAEAIRRHKVGLVVRLLAREPVTGNPPEALASLLRERCSGHATLGDLWPAENLEAQATMGHRNARLYPLLGSSVMVGDGDGGVVGTLLQALGGRAMVLVPGDPPVHPFGDPEKPAYVPARFPPVSEVWPSAPGAVPRPRGRRTRPHDGEAGLRITGADRKER